MKNQIKIITMLIVLCCGILATLCIVPLVSSKTILIGSIPGSRLLYITVIILFLLSVFLVIIRYRQSRCEKNLIIMIAVVVLSAIALPCFSFLYVLFGNEGTYYTFYAPDRKYCVVAKEWSWLLAGGVVLYERTNPFLVEEKANLTTDDGFEAIRANAYEIEWDDNIVTFTVETMNGHGDKDTAVVEIGVTIQ